MDRKNNTQTHTKRRNNTIIVINIDIINARVWSTFGDERDARVRCSTQWARVRRQVRAN